MKKTLCVLAAAFSLLFSINTSLAKSPLSDFEATSAKMIKAMEAQAKKMGIKGVIVIASMDSDGTSWISKMKSVEVTKALAPDPAKSEYPGWNYIGIAYSKAAEMSDTKANSGSKTRAPYQGEFGYPGGLIKKVPTGYILAAFSGATGEQDAEVSKAGMEALEGKK
jgi:hypothetical protein